MTSHWEPRSLHGYQRILSRDTEAGWLEMKVRMLDPWQRKWCEFHMGDRCFTWADAASSPPEERKRVPLDDILMVETDTKNNNTFMRLVTAERKYYCRGDSADDIRGWVFTFQRAATLDQIAATTARLNEMKLHDPRTATGRSPGVGAAFGPGGSAVRVPSKQGSALGKGSSGHMAVASSVATSSMAMPMSMASSVQTGPGAGGGFLTRKPSDHTGSYMDIAGFKQPSPAAAPLVGQPLSRVPSMSIFGPLDKSSSGTTAPTSASTGRIGSNQSTSSDFWGDTTRSTVSISSSTSSNFFQRDSPKVVASELRATSKSVDVSGPLGRSPCIPIMPNLDRLVGSSETKLAGSFRDESAAGRSSLSDAIAASPTSKLLWSPERSADDRKLVPPSPTMSPYRQRGDSEDGGLFQLDEDDSRSKPSMRLDNDSKKTVDSHVSSKAPTKIGVLGKLRWTSGLALEQGRCKYMEDRGVNHANAEIALERYTAGQAPGVISDSDEDCSGYFGIYDGHDGNQASEYIHKVLHFEIMKHRLFETDIEAAMIETCKVVDETLLAKFRKEDVHCGSTALGAFIRKGRLTVFSVGDCRAVLCRSNEPVEMNDPHRPLKLEETLRIERANGWVTTERVINLLQKRVDLTDPEIADIVGLNIEADTSYDVGRVIGDVSVSRAFGDPDYKGFVRGEDVQLLLSWPQNHNKMFYDDIIISEPEMMSVDLTEEDEFLVMASDGVWDVMNPEQAVRKVKNEISAGMTAEEAARALCDLALRLGSSDNISAIVVIFEHS